MDIRLQQTISICHGAAPFARGNVRVESIILFRGPESPQNVSRRRKSVPRSWDEIPPPEALHAAAELARQEIRREIQAAHDQEYRAWRLAAPRETP